MSTSLHTFGRVFAAITLRVTLVTLSIVKVGLTSAQTASPPARQWHNEVTALMSQVSVQQMHDAGGVRHSKWTDSGTFVRAADGDTLAVKTLQHGLVTVRVAGVDAPERDMRHAQESTRFLQAFARSSPLTLNCTTIDRYGRHVCEVRSGQRDLGAELVAAGLAWHFKRYAHEQSDANRVLYDQLEADARAKRLGLWADLDAMKPELCRSFKREGLSCR